MNVYECTYICMREYMYTCIWQCILYDLEYLNICLTVVTQVYVMLSMFLKHFWAKPMCRDENHLL